MPDIAIHRFTTPGIGSVNTDWVETPASIIVIDGQRELSKARAARAEIDATGKPIVAVFLTHPHPDHFGGLGVFAPEGAGIPVYGSRQTRTASPRTVSAWSRLVTRLLAMISPNR